MTTLEDLITRANNVLAVLENLIEGDAAETPIAETGDAPTYDEATGLWIFAQALANANGEYLGIYKLPLATLCSVLRDLDIIAFTAPQAPNTPARILPCGEDPLNGWVNLPALVDLDGQQMNQFSIRSATAFEVRMRLQQNPDYNFVLNYGSIVSQSGGLIRFASEERTGQGPLQNVEGTFSPTGTCRKVKSVTMIEGTLTAQYSIDCGGQFAEAPILNVCGQSFSVANYNNVPFVIEIEFAPC